MTYLRQVYNHLRHGGRGAAQRAAIAGIADIARHRRDRERRDLPLIHTDDTDRRVI